MAKTYIQKALKIDKNLAEAHTTLGFINCYTDWKWEEAEKELLKAIELNPNYAFAHQIYAQLLDIKGDAKRARAEIDFAIKLEPLSPIMHYISGTLYYNEGKFIESLKEFEEVLSLENNFPGIGWWRFKNYYRLEKDDLAMNEIKKILVQNPVAGNFVDSVNIVYNERGLKGLIDWYIDTGKIISRDNLEAKEDFYNVIYEVELYAIANHKNDALSILEQYIETHTGSDRLLRLINNLDYKPLHSEPRFKTIINRLGLDSYYNNPPL